MIRFAHKNNVRFVFISSCLQAVSCLIYVLCVCCYHMIIQFFLLETLRVQLMDQMDQELLLFLERPPSLMDSNRIHSGPGWLNELGS